MPRILLWPLQVAALLSLAGCDGAIFSQPQPITWNALTGVWLSPPGTKQPFADICVNSSSVVVRCPEFPDPKFKVPAGRKFPRGATPDSVMMEWLMDPIGGCAVFSDVKIPDNAELLRLEGASSVAEISLLSDHRMRLRFDVTPKADSKQKPIKFEGYLYRAKLR